MNTEASERLARYEIVAPLSQKHSVFLVQREDTKTLYVKKELTIYNPKLYDYLRTHPIPHMPKIVEVVEDGERLIVIEEYVKGDTLEQILAERGCLDEKTAVTITISLCRILRQLHSIRPAVIHRDLKPSNIILSENGEVKLLDMNAAKWEHPAAARDTELIGTVGYAAPEQYGFGSSTTQTDIYSVGVLLNVMLTGKFPGESQVRGDLGEIVRSCTRLEPKERYKDMDALIRALKQASRRQPEASPWRSLLPPGLGSRNGAVQIVAAVGYLLVIYFGITLQVKGAGTMKLWLNRVCFLALFLGEILFWGNYGNIHRRMRLTETQNPLLRFLGKLVVSAGYFALIMTVLTTVESMI